MNLIIQRRLFVLCREASVAVLTHAARVHKVEFNSLGTTLAVATEDNKLYLYKPDFAGKLLLVSLLGGVADEGVANG